MSRLRLPWPAAAAAVGVVALLAATEPTDGAGSVVAALVLAPVATLAVARIASRIHRAGWFPPGAALVYAVLPLAADLYFLAPYRHVYRSEIAPALVGLQATRTFAAGVAVAVVAAYAPRAPAAALGVLAAGIAAARYGFSDLVTVKNGVHETGWSIAFAEWLPLAGFVGALRRSSLLAVALAGWLLAVVLWGAHGGYDGGSFWRSLAAAWPAIAVLISSLALLVPPLRPAPAARRAH